MRFVTAYEIAVDICINLGDSQLLQMSRVIRNVANAVHELYNNALPFVESKIFEVPVNLIVVLPDNAGLVTKVGVITAGGKMSMLYPENGIRRALRNTLDECIDEPVDPTFFNCNTGNEIVPRYGYVADPSARGTYRFDMQSGTIELGGGGMVNVGDDIVVEYKSHSNDRYQLIPEEAKSLVYQRGLFHYKSATKPAEAEIHFRQFVREFVQLKRNVSRQAPEVYLRALTAGHHSSVK